MEVAEVPKSAQDAFNNHTISTVRAIEKQVRASVLQDKERLRALVGGNYRDLLSTAEEIIALDRLTRNAEAQISELSQQCKPPQQQSPTRSASSISSTSAQLRLLIQCVTYAALALQTRSILLCAELVVVARLLLKSLGDQNPIPQAIDGLRKRSATLRRRLLRLIDYQLAHPSSNTESLVQSICAYCLVTSASSGDAVKHFRGVRLEKLRQRVDSDDKGQFQTQENYRYLVTSVQLLKSLLGRSVNDALSLLQRQPILQGQNILKLEALDIDRLRNLIPQDIITFTPYIKRVLLKQDEVQRLSSQWVEEACQIFAKGLQAVLAHTKSVGDVFALRKDLFSTILPVYFSVHARETLLETVRQASKARVLDLCQIQGETLVHIGQKVIAAESKATGDSSLWEKSVVQPSLASGSARYVQQVRSSHLGTKGSLNHLVKSVRLWARNVSNLRNQFGELASVRWQDLLEEPDDDDEEAAQEVISKLSKDDPRQFREAMELAMQTTVSKFSEIMRDAADQAIQSQGDQSGEVTRIVYLLRTLRECSTILASSIPENRFETADIVLSLHEVLADRVTAQIMSSMTDSSESEGTFQHLPDDLPSPQAFRILREICKIMADVGGTDIWSPAATSILKVKLRSQLLADDKPSVYIPTDFDKHYIRVALSTRSEIKKSTDTNNAESKANSYWRRTQLLFGALG